MRENVDQKISEHGKLLPNEELLCENKNVKKKIRLEEQIKHFLHKFVVQPVITTRIYVLHEITIALKFMSYINSDLQIPAKKLQTPG